MINYSIKDIIRYREIDWAHSEDFLYIADIPDQFEPFTLKPDYFCCGIVTSGKLQIKVDGVIHNVIEDSF